MSCVRGNCEHEEHGGKNKDETYWAKVYAGQIASVAFQVWDGSGNEKKVSVRLVSSYARALAKKMCKEDSE